MKTHTFAAIAFLVVPSLALTTAAEVTAEPQQGRQAREDMRWRGMDTNGDGRITRAEWRGSDRAFRNHDWNNDGVLSGDEVRPGAARSPQQGSMASRQGDFYDWTDDGFRELDRNGDNRITRAEWWHDPIIFTRADRNGDDVLTRAEFLRNAASNDRGDLASPDRFDALDTNGNGRIERREWQGTREGFEWLDRNNDGWLSRAETIANEEREFDGTFAALDTNGNGTIERNEWPGTPRSFDLRDRNSDGRLTEAEAGELRAAGTSGQLAEAADVVRVDARERWTDTGVMLRSGDRLHLRAEGTVVLSGNDSGNDTANAAGAFSGRRAPGAPVPSANAGALIARIGDGEPFVVGRESWSSRVYESGRLFLAINDDHLDDNRGSLRVRISIER